VPFGPPNVDGVGPDARHPFIIRDMKIWNVRWAIHPVAPAVMLDRVDIQNADYRVWRPQYKLHAYRGIKFPQKPIGGLGRDAPSDEAEFPRPLDPVDDLPPITVITHLRRGEGKLVVRGTTSDNGTVKRVTVNGRDAKALMPNHAQWEIVLDDAQPGRPMRVCARAEDAAGNIEKRPHTLVVAAAGSTATETTRTPTR
jgi:hypothetical protein